MARRALVLAHRAPLGVSHLRASIVPSLYSADAFGPARCAEPARYACLQGIGCAAHPRRAPLGAPLIPPNRLRRIDPFAPSALRALACVGSACMAGPCLFSRLSFPHHLLRDRSPRRGAVKAHQAVSSPLAAGRTTPGASSLTAPRRALLWPRAMNSGKTVATRPTGFLVPTPPESPKRALNLGIR